MQTYRIRGSDADGNGVTLSFSPLISPVANDFHNHLLINCWLFVVQYCTRGSDVVRLIAPETQPRFTWKAGWKVPFLDGCGAHRSNIADCYTYTYTYICTCTSSFWINGLFEFPWGLSNQYIACLQGLLPCSAIRATTTKPTTNTSSPGAPAVLPHPNSVTTLLATRVCWLPVSFPSTQIRNTSAPYVTYRTLLEIRVFQGLFTNTYNKPLP
jgi:hypothetical protein